MPVVAAGIQGLVNLVVGIGPLADIIATTIIAVASTVAMTQVARIFAPKIGMGTLKQQAMMVNVRDPAATRQIIYGMRKVSGVFYPVGVSGTNNEYLHVLLLIAGHECADLGTIWFNDEVVPLDASGNATGTYAGYVTIKKHLGGANQTVDTDLQTALGSGVWSNDHRLRGVAYLYLRLKVGEVFNTGFPEIWCLVKGRKVWNPADGAQSATDASTWTWTDNAALCLLDWLRGVPMLNAAGALVRNYGLGAADDEIDTTAVTEAAGICDETVGLGNSWDVVTTSYNPTQPWNINVSGLAALSGVYIGLPVTGPSIPSGAKVTFLGTEGPDYYFSIDQSTTSALTGATVTFGEAEKRYTANGMIMTSTLAGDGIDVFRSAMAGDCVYIGGKWVVRAGAYRTPTVTLTESDFRAPLTEVVIKPSRRDLLNGVKGVYISPQNNWQPSDFPPVVNSTYMTEDGGERLWRDIELQLTTSSATAQRLSKIILEESRQTIQFVAKCKLTMMQVQTTDVVLYTDAFFGWVSKPFRVIGWALAVENDANGNPYLGVDLTLRETAAGVYDWADGEETTVDLAPNTTLPDPTVVLPPGSLTLLSDATTSVAQDDGTFLPRLKVSWTASTDPYVTNGGSVIIEYKRHADSVWLTWSALSGFASVDYITDVRINEAYDVRVKLRNNLPKDGDYAQVNNYTIVGAATPGAPTGLTLSTAAADLNRVPVAYAGEGGVKYGAAMLKWTASSAKDVAYYEVWRSAGVPAMVGRTRATEAEFPLYSGFQINPVTDDVYVKAVSRWGLTSSASTALTPVMSFSTNYGTANMAEQFSTGVAVSGISTGNGSSVRKVLCRYPFDVSVTATGGSATEDFNVSLTNRGFLTRPDFCTAIDTDSTTYLASYQPSAGGSTSTNAVVRVRTVSGGNIGAGAGITLRGELVEWD